MQQKSQYLLDQMLLEIYCRLTPVIPRLALIEAARLVNDLKSVAGGFGSVRLRSEMLTNRMAEETSRTERIKNCFSNYFAQNV